MRSDELADQLQAEVARLTAERDRLREDLENIWQLADRRGEEIQQLRAVRDALAAQLARAETVIEAAIAWRPIHGSKHDPCLPARCGQKTCALTRAVDAYQATPAPTEREGAGDGQA